jgi:hypothetical protein
VVPTSGRPLEAYLPNPKEAALMTWWDDEHNVGDDMIAHQADGTQWECFNAKHKEFSED